MKGLAPGMLEDARDALNPIPIFQAVIGTGYPKCKQVTLPVGDLNGNTRSPYDPDNVWIKGDINPGNTQTRWIQDRDGSGPITISQVDYQTEQKLYYPDGTTIENFMNQHDWSNKTVATVLLASLVASISVFIMFKQR